MIERMFGKLVAAGGVIHNPRRARKVSVARRNVALDIANSGREPTSRP
ncbi:hypothetical protein ACQPZP_13935 [Spirillospora sp. CA-142024]